MTLPSAFRSRGILSLLALALLLVSLTAVTLYGGSSPFKTLYPEQHASVEKSSMESISDLPVGTVPVGQGPRALAFDPVNGDLYVADFISGNVTVVNGATDTSVASISVGVYPDAIAYDPVSGNIFVSCGGTNSVQVINTTSNRVTANLPVGLYPDALAIGGNNSEIFVANYDSNNITLLSAKNGTTLGSVRTGLAPAAEAFDRVNGNLYVANSNSANVTVFNAASNRASSVGVGQGPDAVSVDTETNTIYVANWNTSTTTVLDGVKGGILATIQDGGVYPDGITFDDANWYLYETDWQNTTVEVINGGTPSLVGHVPVGQNPDAVVYDGDNLYLYVANYGSNDLTVIDGGMSILTGVYINPTFAMLHVGAKATLTATPGCTGGGCHPGIVYKWTASDGLGTLSSGSGSTVVFTAGLKAGNISLYVNASLDGVSVKNGPVQIEIFLGALPVLESVSIDPQTFSTTTGGSLSLSALATCYPEGCPSAGLSFSWSSTNSSLGSLSQTSGSQVTFQAGSQAGSETVFVTASLNGKSLTVMAQIAVKVPNGPLGLPDGEGYVTIGAMGALTAAAVFLMWRKRRRTQGMVPETYETEPPVAPTEQEINGNGNGGHPSFLGSVSTTLTTVSSYFGKHD